MDSAVDGGSGKRWQTPREGFRAGWRTRRGVVRALENPPPRLLGDAAVEGLR
jgi:hypothetical protein